MPFSVMQTNLAPRQFRGPCYSQARMRPQFIINPAYILLHSIENTHDGRISEAWAQRVRGARRDAPLLASGTMAEPRTSLQTAEDLAQAFNTASIALTSLMRTAEFQNLLAEVRVYGTWVERQWEAAGDRALHELETIIGLPLPDTSVDVFVTHPKLANGRYVRDVSAICWGHSEDWENYTVVYLCHELAHMITDGRYRSRELMHALIELATDNELRIRLNGKSAYFEEKGHKVGHARLRRIERDILPIWRQYLAHEIDATNLLSLEEHILARPTAKHSLPANDSFDARRAA